MSSCLKRLIVSLTLVALAVPALAHAKRPVELSCSVAVDYVFRAQDGTMLATVPYQTDFVVQPGVEFVDDFSTPTRVRQFRASVTLDAGQAIVAIDYFNDVGVFHSIDLATTLTLLNGRDDGTTSGTHTFSTSLTGLNGHHTTSHILACQRA